MEEYCEYVFNGLVAINAFMAGVYHRPLWVSPQDAGMLGDLGLTFLRTLNQLAIWSLEKSLPRFKVNPKLHLFSHVCHAWLLASRRGHETLNVLAFSVQLDEDFVGKIATQSRHVSIRSVHERTIQRYMLNLALRW